MRYNDCISKSDIGMKYEGAITFVEIDDMNLHNINLSSMQHNLDFDLKTLDEDNIDIYSNHIVVCNKNKVYAFYERKYKRHDEYGKTTYNGMTLEEFNKKKDKDLDDSFETDMMNMIKQALSIKLMFKGRN